MRLVVAVVASAIVFFPLYWMLVIAFSPRGEVFSPGPRASGRARSRSRTSRRSSPASPSRSGS
ncbi:hypothetical protein Q0F99_09970 [Rathayibacter oskolensis]|uniref:hypothetical protein n=1 Tax=Rathayibacter oskolensis TaxID=1891671 RepID=UPI00265DA2FE|nr:hypothetical protein [Rathayibacter oskolensis]WKK73131.1 hypothetical protein Q0F99_09970 [Rathayibacter oskolensis]